MVRKAEWSTSPLALTKRCSNLLMKWGLPIILFLAMGLQFHAMGYMTYDNCIVHLDIELMFNVI